MDKIDEKPFQNNPHENVDLICAIDKTQSIQNILP